MKQLDDILPADLKATFESLDYEEEGGLTIQSIKYLNSELHFDFALELDYIEPNEPQLWQLQIKNYRDGKIDLENLGSYFEFYSDHFLLWEYTDAETELYFKKATDNPEKLLADIYTIHNRTFDNYIPLEKFLNGNNLLTLCSYSIGKFARGPKKILSYYFECLEKAGSEPYFYGDFVPKIWSGEQFIQEDKDLKIVTLGSTYFVGKDFFFRRLEK
jgi:hypothetical protein